LDRRPFWTWHGADRALALCLVVLGPHVARLEFLDVLLGNRAAQVSVEVYQRMLAGDRDEVHDQAGLC
jgi:hypothetical protein